ncbi:MAG: recombination regulator RecX [Treponema sp.]|nr:recombination regulator RecX [Treponema sp.]
MTLTSLKTRVENNANLLKVEISDGSSFNIKDFYLDYYINTSGSRESGTSFTSWNEYASMEIGTELTESDRDLFRFSASCYSAERTGLRLINRAEQTQAGLSRKLQSRGYDQPCVTAVLNWFTQADLVNDERYAERWLRTKLLGRAKGPSILYAALSGKGLSRETIKNAIDSVLDEDSEYELLKKFMVKKRTRSLSGTYSLKGYLRHEGFSSRIINRYFEEFSDND